MKLLPFSAKHEDSLLDSTARLNILEGAVRSGKTVVSLVRWLEYIEREAPAGGRLFMVGKTEKTLRMNVIDPILDLVGDKRFRVNSGLGFSSYKGKKIYHLGANDERAESKIRGATAGGIYGDQIELWPETFFRMGLSRMSLPGAKFFGTCNPDSPYHWLKTEFLDRSGELGIARWHFHIDDNPALPPEFVAALKLEYGPPGSLWYKRFIEGLWVLAEGVIYDLWDEDRFVVDLVPPGIEVLDRSLAADYGTANPFHALCGEVRTDVDGVERIYVTGEYRWDSTLPGNRQKTDSQYSSDLKAWLGELPYNRFWMDPSAASMLRQLYLDGFHGVGGADNAVLDGIRVVSSLFAQDRLRIHRSCVHLIREIAGYSWDPKAQERGEDKPLKRDDHGPDALRYLVMGLRRFWRRWLTWVPNEGEEETA